MKKINKKYIYTHNVPPQIYTIACLGADSVLLLDSIANYFVPTEGNRKFDKVRLNCRHHVVVVVRIAIVTPLAATICIKIISMIRLIYFTKHVTIVFEYIY